VQNLVNTITKNVWKKIHALAPSIKLTKFVLQNLQNPAMNHVNNLFNCTMKCNGNVGTLLAWPKTKTQKNEITPELMAGSSRNVYHSYIY
jgi:hypothetical protein